jgi:biopolymer transport protein ExbB
MRKEETMKRILSILLPLALMLSFSLVAATPVMAQSWLTGWSYRVEITIDSAKIDEALVDFPVLLYLSTSSGTNPDDVSFVFDELGAEKLKLAVTTGDGITQCYVEIEKWDSISEQAWLWVKVPNIASDADTTLYLYYDSTQPDNTTWVGETGTTPAQNVWDSDFVFVCHMRDDPDASHIGDSTASGNDGTKKGGGEPAVTTAGQIDAAQDFDGTDDYIGLSNEPAFDMQTATTVEGWIRLDSFTQPSTVASKWRNMGVDFRSWLLTISTAGQPRFYVSRDGIEPSHCAGSALSVLSWYHLAGTYGDSYIRLFVNSSPATPVAQSGNIYTNNEPVLLGATDGWGGTARKYTDGIIDEVRISDIARSAAWIKATYHSGDDSLLSYGSEESAPPPSPVVGWETYPINKVRVLLPWIALIAVIMAGAGLLVLRQRRAQS